MSSGGIGSLLNTSQSSLSSQTQAIRVIGDNIANANVEGYSRRRANLETITSSAEGSSFAIGNGVNVKTISRIVDKFVNSQLLSRISDRAGGEAKSELLSRAESPFSLDQSVARIGSQLSEFFSALDDLSSNPADLSLRQNIIEQGSNLSQSIKLTYNIVADLQREADDRIGIIVSNVNQISSDIADVNTQIKLSEVGPQESLALRDKRDQLLGELSEAISVKSVENSDGTMMVTLSNGFALVSGTQSNSLEFTGAPSFAPPGGFPLGLDGGTLRHIVFDYDSTSTTEHIDLTNIIAAAGGGEIGGLLGVRGVQATTDTSPFDPTGDLVTIGARVETIARDLLVRFNQSYLGAVDEDPITAGFQASSVDLNGNNPSPFGLFSVAGATDDDGDGLPSVADLQASTAFVSYANEINFAISDPSSIAAAIDLDTVTPGSTPFGTGDNTNLRNLLTQQGTSQNYTVGSFSTTATIEELYDTTVTFVGSRANTATNELLTSSAREEQVIAMQQDVSGVSLDEEFAKLINFQRAYEGSARIIRIGDELLRELIGLLG